MKKFAAISLATFMMISSAGCGIGGSKQAPSKTGGTDIKASPGVTAEAKATPAASKFPTKPIEIIVPFGAGGGADISIRMLAKYAEKNLGQKIVVNNVTGGSGTIGITQLAGEKNDGYKLGYFASTNSNDNLLFKGVTYTIDSFTPIVQIAADPHILIASKKSGIKSVNDLIAKAKEKPEQLTFGIGGAWTSWDFLKIKLEEKTGIKMKRMVFQGGAAAINSVASGDCDVAVPFVSEALPQIQAGNVVPIGITSANRFKLAENIPTIKELGLDFEHTMWRGLVAPKGIPQDVTDALVKAFKAAYDDPQYQADALAAGIFIQFKGGEDFKKFFLENHEVYKKMIKDANIAAQ